ncbi:MAG: biliverdin-producing heme oxygenase [Chloroflexota bacterium]
MQANVVLAESGVINALRSATRSQHAQLAASEPMRRLFDAAYTVAEYRAHLGRLLGLFEPLERAAAQASDPSVPVLGLHRASALRADLVHLGAATSEIESLERCGHLPRLELAGLRGYTYVMLGSMLEANGQNDVQAICATAVGIFDAYAAWLATPLPYFAPR